jgi:hypothetical protein
MISNDSQKPNTIITITTSTTNNNTANTTNDQSIKHIQTTNHISLVTS